ncbi:hypothetical protein NCLIV_049240 [Neospora caninum Liverpool]|uniref:PNPLA domain-containing protein n=1 Tax=Neospora caninum (strain Liverpool) TaxID=572307 RepID=F0VK94_NEOCL|nr:hypothetical protein NCLIV_049240 [Neospora caninum Liverpool]CBZ54495.1 hypothetical protein NCLIV_049240 [Neospora caninum Liverpool]|eukprot:XP_003884525.1 hypothetical protein NCLIV_049240 [Neospora caninum Liverpool]
MADDRGGKASSPGDWRRLGAETRSPSEELGKRLEWSSTDSSGDSRAASSAPSPPLVPSLNGGWRAENVVLREDANDTASFRGFAPNLFLPSAVPTPHPTDGAGVSQLFVSPRRHDDRGPQAQGVQIPLPPGADRPVVGSDDAPDEDCHEWGVGGETGDEEDKGEDDVDESVIFWRRMPAGDRLRWAAGRVFRMDTHSILAVPIFFVIASILTVEVFFYICVRLLIALTEAVFFHLASLAYWFRSVFLRRVFASGTPAGKEVNRAVVEASERVALAAEDAALEFTGLGGGAPESPALRTGVGAPSRAAQGTARPARGEAETLEGGREDGLLGRLFACAFRLLFFPLAFASRAWERGRVAAAKQWRGVRFWLPRKNPEGAEEGARRAKTGDRARSSHEETAAASDREKTRIAWDDKDGGEDQTRLLRNRTRHGNEGTGDGRRGGEAQENASREKPVANGLQDRTIEWQTSLLTDLAEEAAGESLMSHRGKLFKATTYDEYARLALIMDKITGREKWKHELETPLYDYEAVGKRLHILKKARQSGKLSALQEALRGSLRDQMFGVFRERLYSRTYLGTKIQAEEFIDEVCLCLKELKRHVRHCPDEVRRSFQQLQTSWGVTGLILSGGASLGLHHFGVLEVLLKARAEGRSLLPRAIGGCSAGAVVAAWLCTRTDDELLRQGTVEYLVEHWKALSPNSWLFRLWNILTKGYMCDIDVWKASAKKLFGDLTFLEAYQRTGRVLNISMTRADREESGVQVMNYVTAPNVLIWSAILCSCAFPFLSLPLPLREKSPKGKAVISKVFGCSYFHDGSLSGDIPTEQMREAWGVSYSIVSQVNPHVFPFAGLRTHGEAGIPRFLLRLIALLDVSPTLRGINAGSLALQSYTGDVTLHPRYISARYLRLLNDTRPSDISWNRMRIDRCFEDLAQALEEASTFAPAGNSRGVQKVF